MTLYPDAVDTEAVGKYPACNSSDRFPERRFAGVFERFANLLLGLVFNAFVLCQHRVDQCDVCRGHSREPRSRSRSRSRRASSDGKASKNGSPWITSERLTSMQRASMSVRSSACHHLSSRLRHERSNPLLNREEGRSRIRRQSVSAPMAVYGFGSHQQIHRELAERCRHCSAGLKVESMYQVVGPTMKMVALPTESCRLETVIEGCLRYCANNGWSIRFRHSVGLSLQSVGSVNGWRSLHESQCCTPQRLAWYGSRKMTTAADVPGNPLCPPLVKSVSGNDDDCDEDERRDQRKGAIQPP
jgi:hypothetical protein